jgi:glycosyltransferase involved in cell wall biosynthesis
LTTTLGRTSEGRTLGEGLREHAGWAIVRLGSKLLPHVNRRTTCPPGRLRNGTGPLVIVASLRRSGTHLLIDTILNNFDSYRRRPLYVNLDALLDDHDRLEELRHKGGYVVKTHYPSDSMASPRRTDRVAELAAHAVVIAPSRPLPQLVDARAASRRHNRLPVEDDADIATAVGAFDMFWRPYDPLTVPFGLLTDPAALAGIVQRVADATGQTPRPRIVAPPHRDQRMRTYATKAATRLLGDRSPVVNTTVGFALPRAPACPGLIGNK